MPRSRSAWTLRSCRTDDPRAFAEAALGYCSDRVRLVPPAEQAACLRAAIATLPYDEHALGARLLARPAFETYWVEPVSTARQLAAEALRRSLLSGDVERRASTPDMRSSGGIGNRPAPRRSSMPGVCTSTMRSRAAIGCTSCWPGDGSSPDSPNSAM